MPNEDILEARLQQADEHQEDTTSKLDVVIEQNEQNNPNPNLEALIEAGDNNSNKVVEKLDELKPKKEDSLPTKQLMTFLSGFFEQMRGAKGDKGDKGNTGKTGAKGDKGNSIEGVKGEKGDKGESIVGEKGDTGNPGKHGNDAKVDIDELVEMTLARITKPKDGKDADIKELLKMVLSKIKSLKEDDRISYNDLKDTPQMYKDPVIGGISNTTVLQNLDGNPENLSAQCDGTNTKFDVANGILSVIFLSLNGQVLLEGLDFTKSTNQITLLRNIPKSGEELYIKYVQI